MANLVSVESPAVPDPATHPRDSANASTLWRFAAYAIGGVLALVPVVRMIDIVADGSMLQYADYWIMLPRFVNADGSLDVIGLFHFHNEHPVVIPQFIYWLNMRLFSGSNIALGFVVVALALGQLVVVALLLRHSALRRVERIAVFVLASALLFDLTGTWNFAKAMSGTAWISANLFAMTAVYLRSRDRGALAFGVAVLAAISYGTGVVAWVAVIATGMARRPVRQWWREWPYAVGFAVTVVWYRLSGPPDSGAWQDPVATVRLAASLFGSVFGATGDLAELIGAVALIGVPVLVVGVGLWSRAAGAAGWVGVATFGWLSMLEIAGSRGEYFAIFGGANRYSSLAAITWLGFAVLALYATRGVGDRLASGRRTTLGAALSSPWMALALITPLFLGALTAGRTHADVMLAGRAKQELSEIALRLGLAGDARQAAGMFPGRVAARDLLIETGHYPFVGGWDLDCGLFAQDPIAAAGDGQAIEGSLFAKRATVLPRVVELSGYLSVDDPIRCVVITNDEGEVVGAATVGVDDLAAAGTIPPDATGFRALAPRRLASYRAYAVLEGGAEPRFVDDLEADERGAG